MLGRITIVIMSRKADRLNAVVLCAGAPSPGELIVAAIEFPFVARLNADE
jgi:hypothetical protein